MSHPTRKFDTKPALPTTHPTEKSHTLGWVLLNAISFAGAKGNRTSLGYQ